jgi:hypothetical protein
MADDALKIGNSSGNGPGRSRDAETGSSGPLQGVFMASSEGVHFPF